MSTKQSAKAALSIAFAAAVMLFSQTCFAASATGRITVYHLNNDVPGRGSCIQMSPAIPGTWACVWKKSLFNETNELFHEGYIFGKTCTVSWSTNDINGFHIVDFAQCQ
jgi:hypothetical protein